MTDQLPSSEVEIRYPIGLPAHGWRKAVKVSLGRTLLTLDYGTRTIGSGTSARCPRRLSFQAIGPAPRMTAAGRRLVARLTGFAGLLQQRTGQDDLVIDGRGGPSFHDPGQLVGHCVNLLPLRLQISGADSFTDALRATRGALLGAFDLVRQAETFELFINVVDNGSAMVLEASYRTAL